MMDATLAQILNHIYELEEEKAVIHEFLLKNEGVLRAANAVVPGLPEETVPTPETATTE